MLSSYRELKNYRLVGERHGLTYASVWERLKDVVGPTKDKLAKVSTEDLVRYLKEGKTIREIAHLHGVTNPATLYVRAKKEGFKFSQKRGQAA